MSMSNEMMAAAAAAILVVTLLLGCGEGAGTRGNDNGGTEAIAVSASGTPDTPSGARRNVLFIGTSLTAGLGLEPENAYPSLIAEKIDSAGLPYAVTNAGISGETSAGLVRRLDWLLEGAFDVVVVETGANDGLRGIPVRTARENIDSILTRIDAERPEAEIVLVEMESPPNLGRAYTTAFRTMYRELAARHGAVLMPFLLEGVAGEGRLNQNDGIHPNEAGARRVAENVWNTLAPILLRRASVSAAAPGPSGASARR